MHHWISEIHTVLLGNLDRIQLIAGLYVVLGFFEITFPAERGQRFRTRWRNIVLTGIFLLGGAVVTSMVYLLIPIEGKHLPGLGLWYSLIVLFFYILLTDMMFYWYHRAQHSFRFFWPIHELHHSDAELNATTGLRTYWLEQPLQALFVAIPVGYLIGTDPTSALLLPFALTGWLFFAHANWKLRLGFLTPVICGPQLHRIHHSNRPEHQNKNFAQFFPFIDVLFGTYYAPAYDEFPTTGTDGLASNASIAAIMMKPFTQKRPRTTANYADAAGD